MDLFDNYKTPDIWKPSMTSGNATLGLFGSGNESFVGATESELIDRAMDVVDGLKTARDTIADRTNISITNFINKMIVTARVYIQNGIADDPTIDDNLASIQNQYLGFILAALGMNDTIINNRTVRDLVQVVSTERFRSINEIATEALGPVMATPDADEQRRIKDDLRKDKDDARKDRDEQRKEEDNQRKFKDDLRKSNDERRKDRDEERKNRDEYRKDKEDARKDAAASRTNSSSSVNKESRELSLSSGRIVEFEFEGPQGRRKINIPVHMVPKIIPDEVAEQFIALNFTLDKAKRYLQVLAGEKSFFKDFIFQMDLLKKRTDALKKDTSGVLYDMLKYSDNKAAKAIRENTKAIIDANTKPQNMANTVLIYDKASFMSYAHDAGLKWSDANAREKFFNKSMSFMVVLIDPVYNVSEYYWSGFEFSATYTAKQLKAAKSKDSYDLKDIMTAFTQGVSPKF